MSMSNAWNYDSELSSECQIAVLRVQVNEHLRRKFGGQAVNLCHEAKCLDPDWVPSFDMPERTEHSLENPPGRTRIGFALVPVKASKRIN